VTSAVRDLCELKHSRLTVFNCLAEPLCGGIFSVGKHGLYLIRGQIVSLILGEHRRPASNIQAHFFGLRRKTVKEGRWIHVCTGRRQDDQWSRDRLGWRPGASLRYLSIRLALGLRENAKSLERCRRRNVRLSNLLHCLSSGSSFRNISPNVRLYLGILLEGKIFWFVGIFRLIRVLAKAIIKYFFLHASLRLQ
jgi:hypothetical protein